MTRRSGLSLTEVLVALFLVAIGVLGVLTLFPVGAVQMGAAFRDQRVAECAANADAYIRWVWRHEVIEKERTTPNSGDPLFQALTNPDSTASGNAGPTHGVTAVSTTASPAEPSFPVVIDPMGAVARSSPDKFWIGDTGTTDIPRRTVQLISNLPSSAQQAFTLRTCTLMDGLGYTEDGVVDQQGGAAQRENRYNWMWVVQRPDNSTAAQFTANLTVVVFDRRIHMYAPAGSEEVKSVTSFTPTSTSCQIPKATGGAPPLTKGNWVMDATVLASGTNRVRHAKFYRVVSVTDPDPTATTGNVDVEFDRPITRIDGKNTPADAYTANLVIMPGVAEVFDRAPLAP